jgi:hypothetical protein
MTTTMTKGAPAADTILPFDLDKYKSAVCSYRPADAPRLTTITTIRGGEKGDIVDSL